MTVRCIHLASVYVAECARLRRLIQRIVGDRTVAEDLAQDTFLRLNGRVLNEGDRGLLVRTARNLAIDHLRAQRVRQTYAESTRHDAPRQDVPVDDALAARQELAGLMEALQVLPRRTQQIFLLNRLDGLPQPMIARMMGLSLSTVEKEIIRALAFCRRWQMEQKDD